MRRRNGPCGSDGPRGFAGDGEGQRAVPRFGGVSQEGEAADPDRSGKTQGGEGGEPAVEDGGYSGRWRDDGI